jgi:pimeloyl-ACP methyl ester carboxylesterase
MSTITTGYSSLPTKLINAANGVDYAYRDTGPTDGEVVPLVLLQHFRGNLDNWDPALVDALASHRRVITFDNTGVAASSGTTANTIEQMAYDAIPSSPPWTSTRPISWASPSAASSPSRSP